MEIDLQKQNTLEPKIQRAREALPEAITLIDALILSEAQKGFGYCLIGIREVLEKIGKENSELVDEEQFFLVIKRYYEDGLRNFDCSESF